MAPGGAEKLRRYWSTGEGAAKIRWRTKGDFTRCVRLLSKHMPGRAAGYCALLHKRNTGMYTGDKAHRAMSHADTPTLMEAAVALGIAHPDTLQLAGKPWENNGKIDNKPGKAKPGETPGNSTAAAAKQYAAMRGKDPAAVKAMLDKLTDPELRALARVASAGTDPTRRAWVMAAMGRRNTSDKPSGKAKPPAKPFEKKITASHVRLSHAEIDTLELAGPNPAARKQMANAGEAMADGSFPIRDRAALRKAVLAFGRAAPEKQNAVKAHIRKRARALGGENLLPKQWA